MKYEKYKGKSRDRLNWKYFAGGSARPCFYVHPFKKHQQFFPEHWEVFT